ncbi:MAG: YcfA-like protein [Candidatus Methanofastidiosum methylothiophilum]|uniref:YcfA-like protein n=1 Tax=Candidatus Methanofastidiosum methylothiophilum TaxID=1705564 RepID=A0A150ITA6_9EURY|nr:MAG: YcfA-like protein [Candidatus Methanofastidiosum methylthiophilus]KYC48251.1 MAG: YcfA-like protein [Candidatus Methanofastidiosum methylthiophilus]KYC50908.1 MAG: YcfA-like protein [Candidatus Methanofastidiosum methylthiophilus]
MKKLPPISGKELVSFLEKIGFNTIRTKESHIRLKSEDGRYTTVPIHGNKELPKGLLRRIIKEDLELELEEFIDLYNSKK